MRKYLFPLWLCCLCSFYAFAPGNIDYAAYYGPAYQDALQFCKKNNNAFAQAAKKYSLDKKTMQSLIFPELLRYNILQDLMETKTLELLYVNAGSSYADFSIGQFQMKPSFAEQLENLAAEESNAEWADDFYALCSYSDLDEKEIRRIRIERLSQLDWQLRYLACFYRYAERLLPKGISSENKIKIMATRYNAGLTKSDKELEKWMQKPCFPYGTSVSPKMQHVYADLANYYFLKG